MRLWHIDMLPVLPRQQLLGQHREVAALRGNGWGKSHTVVDYVFLNNPIMLYYYHLAVMEEMKARGYRPDERWLDPLYRGKSCKPHRFQLQDSFSSKRYQEHGADYLRDCLNNLYKKIKQAPEGKYHPAEINKFMEFYKCSIQ